MRKSILKEGEKPPKKKHASLEWDEGNLGENAEYLASTTRTKIIEPKTPYQPPLGASATPGENVAHWVAEGGRPSA